MVKVCLVSETELISFIERSTKTKKILTLFYIGHKAVKVYGDVGCFLTAPKEVGDEPGAAVVGPKHGHHVNTQHISVAL
jgi:hypothetical protein